MTDGTGDQILIEGLRVRCVIGVNEDERRAKQDVVLDIALHADLRSPGRSDDIVDTVDYGEVARRVSEHAIGSRFGLVEALAESVADICLALESVTRVDVRVRKPGGVAAADSVGVRIERSRDR